MADNFDEFDDDRDEVEAAEEDALYLAEEVNTDDEGDDDAELASASSTSPASSPRKSAPAR